MRSTRRRRCGSSNSCGTWSRPRRPSPAGATSRISGTATWAGRRTARSTRSTRSASAKARSRSPISSTPGRAGKTICRRSTGSSGGTASRPCATGRARSCTTSMRSRSPRTISCRWICTGRAGTSSRRAARRSTTRAAVCRSAASVRGGPRWPIARSSRASRTSCRRAGGRRASIASSKRSSSCTTSTASARTCGSTRAGTSIRSSTTRSPSA